MWGGSIPGLNQPADNRVASLTEAVRPLSASTWKCREMSDNEQSVDFWPSFVRLSSPGCYVFIISLPLTPPDGQRAPHLRSLTHRASHTRSAWHTPRLLHHKDFTCRPWQLSAYTGLHPWSFTHTRARAHENL